MEKQGFDNSFDNLEEEKDGYDSSEVLCSERPAILPIRSSLRKYNTREKFASLSCSTSPVRLNSEIKYQTCQHQKQGHLKEDPEQLNTKILVANPSHNTCCLEGKIISLQGYIKHLNNELGVRDSQLRAIELEKNQAELDNKLLREVNQKLKMSLMLLL
ncbi:unnamed protein product [Moneuplotes crassus]|uniref:Uncharacterized protein n=1 Tax=Euplotes crassus TaxID=5936 RepID=A0AAD1UI66_EUPCR|nr:unnamed protein product [Moneuplotes crassus]